MSSCVRMNNLQKVVTENEIETGRISIPASVRDYLFPHLAENTKTVLTMVDETRNSYPVEIKLRKNRTKPEIMASGGRRFADTRNLLPGAVLEFSRSNLPETFNVRVRAPQLAPPHLPLPPQEELQLPIGVSTQTQPSVAPHFPTVSFATAGKGFGLPVGSDHLLGGQPFSSFKIGPDHSLGEPPKPMELGLLLSSVQLPMHMQLGLGLASGSGDPPKPSALMASLRFESYMGSNLLLGEPPKLKEETGLELSIGSGQSMGDPSKPSTEMGLELCIGSAQSLGDPPKQSSGGQFRCSDHTLGKPPKRTSMKMELGFGLSLSQAQTLPPANKRPRFSLSGSSANMEADQLPAKPEESPMLDLSLALGNTHHPAAPTTPELSLSIGCDIEQVQPLTKTEMALGRVKSEEQEAGWYPDLSSSLKSNFLHGREAPYLDAALVAGNDLQEPKPPTFLPCVPLSLF